eukprot:Ihof_evm5s334 gene=Ihof_evmTU5s334
MVTKITSSNAFLQYTSEVPLMDYHIADTGTVCLDISDSNITDTQRSVHTNENIYEPPPKSTLSFLSEPIYDVPTSVLETKPADKGYQRESYLAGDISVCSMRSVIQPVQSNGSIPVEVKSHEVQKPKPEQQNMTPELHNGQSFKGLLNMFQAITTETSNVKDPYHSTSQKESPYQNVYKKEVIELESVHIHSPKPNRYQLDQEKTEELVRINELYPSVRSVTKNPLRLEEQTVFNECESKTYENLSPKLQEARISVTASDSDLDSSLQLTPPPTALSLHRENSINNNRWSAMPIKSASVNFPVSDLHTSSSTSLFSNETTHSEPNLRQQPKQQAYRQLSQISIERKTIAQRIKQPWRHQDCYYSIPLLMEMELSRAGRRFRQTGSTYFHFIGDTLVRQVRLSNNGTAQATIIDLAYMTNKDLGVSEAVPKPAISLGVISRFRKQEIQRKKFETLWETYKHTIKDPPPISWDTVDVWLLTRSTVKHKSHH